MVATCKHDENAIIFKRGDVNALSDAIEYAVNNKKNIVNLGLNGLRYAQSRTHQKMHQDREKFLINTVKIT